MTSTQPTGYDLFVSYAPADREWVEGYLLDALQAANVRFIHEALFELGAPRLLEFERAVRQSRRTLLVLTPAYLAQQANQFVDLLATTYGLESGAWPVIPFLLKKVGLPPRLAILQGVEAWSADDWPQAVARVCTAAGASSPAPPSKLRCPYPGLAAYQETDAIYFVGRGAEVEWLLDQLAHHSVALVTGASGEGKSSLIAAGLIPALRESTRFGEGAWCVRRLQPGAAAAAALAGVLGASSASTADLEAAVQQLLQGPPPAARLLIVVDPLEQLLVQGAAEIKAFTEAAMHLAALPQVYLVFAGRSHKHQDLHQSPLWPHLAAQRLDLTALPEASLRSVLVTPAERVGVFMESALVERLVGSTVGEPGGLSILQAILVKLWDKLERRFLSLHAYESLILPYRAYTPDHRTALQRSLSADADRAVAMLPADGEAVARTICVRLVQLGDIPADMRRRKQAITALRPMGVEPSRFAAVIDMLADSRLITLRGGSDQEATAELAHGGMITGWLKLASWLEADLPSERYRRGLEDQVVRWVGQKRRRRGLLDRAALDDAESWLSTQRHRITAVRADDLDAYLACSRSALRSQRVFRTVALAVMGLIVAVALGVAVNTVYKWQLNRAWQAVPGVPSGSISALALAGQSLVIGSYHYGAAWRQPDGAWTGWQRGGLPEIAEAVGLNDETATAAQIRALASSAGEPKETYAYVLLRGLYHWQPAKQNWVFIGSDAPLRAPDGSEPLAAFGDTVLFVGDTKGIWGKSGEANEWRNLAEEAPSLDQELGAVAFDGDGTPFAGGKRGLWRGEGAFPYRWQPVLADVEVEWIAAGADGRLYVATRVAGGRQVGCYSATGQSLGHAQTVPVANYFLEWSGVQRSQVMSLAGDPDAPEQFFVATTHGGVYAMTCSGGASHLGQRSFLATPSSLVVARDVEGRRQLLWANRQQFEERLLE